MRARHTVILAVFAVFAWFAPAGADERFLYYGTTVGGPQFNRPSTTSPFPPTGVIVSYHAQIFQVNQQTTCFVDSIQNGLFDGFLHIYQGSFSPVNSQQNVIRANDDSDLGVGSSRTTTFTALANTQYTVVTSAFSAGTNGDFQNTVNCDSAGLPNPLIISHGDCIGVQNNTQACVSNSRFRISASFATPPSGQPTGQAQVVQYGTGDSALFSFFGPQNIELLVKVLNFCAFSDNAYRVFAAGVTTAGVTVTVSDQVRGGSVTITNPLNSAFQNVVVNIPNSCP